MTEEIRRGPGRPRKISPGPIGRDLEMLDNVIAAQNAMRNGTTHEEPMNTPNEALQDVAVTIAAPVEREKPAEQAKPKLYSFKLEKGTNFASPDFQIVPVDEEGIWQEPREPVLGEDYGPHTKVWPGTIVMVTGAVAKRFEANKIARAINNYD